MHRTDEYTKPVDDFLQSIGVTMTMTGPDKMSPPWSDKQATPSELTRFPRKDHIHGDRWAIKFTRTSNGHVRTLEFPFWDSYSDAELRRMASDRMRFMNLHNLQFDRDAREMLQTHGFKSAKQIPKLADLKPTAYDVLAAIDHYQPGSFEEWCSDMGCDTDSRKAFGIYQLCLDLWSKTSRFFSAEELEKLQELAQ